MASTHAARPGASGSQVFTFLFSDIEGSTRLVARLGSQFATALADHHALLGDVIAAHGGQVRRIEGDSFFATFPAATSALAAAVAAQRRIRAHSWPLNSPLRVRIGVHTGEAVIVGNEFVGLDVHRAARIMSAGWGEQILVSSTTSELLSSSLPSDVTLRDLGDHQLKDLAQPERIHQVVAAGLRSDFPALRSVDAVPNNLPVQLSSFVGRRREIAEVRALLATTRALTLTGPGGTGKTRLSLQVAGEAAAGYPGGTFFVPLASISDPTLVMSAVAGVLGLTPTGERTPLELVVDHLKSSRALVVLDNFEQVLLAAVDVSKLLSAAPDVTVLVSSRSALRISGEQEYAVLPLPLPGRADDLAEVAASEAATLFVTRAAAVRPGFRLDAQNAPAVAQITRRLDGLPLAIELAAARVKLLSVQAIAERLGGNLDLLSAGARDLPARQRTLRGAIAWSYDLLEDPAQRLFARCAVFRGGVDYDDLVGVCAAGPDDDVFDLLAELIDQSLVRRLDDASGARFALLEVIREFAAEQLEARGEGAETRRRHASVYLRLAEEAAPFLTGEQSRTWLDRLERDHDNLRAALRHASDDNDTRTGLRLLAALWRMWQIRGHLHEGRRTADLMLGLPDTDQYPAELATACEAAGGIAYWQADLAASRQRYTRALELYRELGDQERIAHAIYNLAFAHGYAAPERAIELFEEALAAYDTLDDETGRARCHWGLAVASFWIGDFDAMLGHSEFCVPVFRATGQTFDLAWALHMWGLGEVSRSNLDAARPLFAEALDLFIAADDVSGLYLVLADFALLAEAAGDPARALRLFGAVERLAEETGSGLFEGQVNLYPRTRRADEQLDTATVAALRAEGYAMSRDAAVAYAAERKYPAPRVDD